MIDSNTYNELTMTDRAGAPVAFCPSADADDSPVKRLTDNSAAQADLPPEERERRLGEAAAYADSATKEVFFKFMRRHECNVFNALFFDKEPITEEDISIRVRRASEFFGLPIPTMTSQCETLAMITFSNISELGSEIQYDIKELYKTGINNVDAFDTMLTHELSHQFVAGRKFNFCENRQWCEELACDFIAGVRCAAHLIASGKYKYAVSRMDATETHPDGSFRLEAVKSGFDFAEWLLRRERIPTAEAAMTGLTRFLIASSKALNRAYRKFLATPPPPPPEPLDIMALPDTNLIKQAVLKHRAEQEKK